MIYFVDKNHIKLSFIKVANELNARKSTSDYYYFFTLVHGSFVVRKVRPLAFKQMLKVIIIYPNSPYLIDIITTPIITTAAPLSRSKVMGSLNQNTDTAYSPTMVSEKKMVLAT